jgi:hypothetical protein
MCFGLFVATGSFFLGQMKFIPEPLFSVIFSARGLSNQRTRYR